MSRCKVEETLFFWKIEGNYFTKKKYTLKEAKRLSKTLEGCRGCIDCSFCRFCVDCENCHFCKSCFECKDAKWCDLCIRCVNIESSLGCEDCENLRYASTCKQVYKGKFICDMKHSSDVFYIHSLENITEYFGGKV